MTVYKTTITVAGDCAAFDADAAAAASPTTSTSRDQITVVKNCGGERRRFVEEFTLDVEVVARNDGVTSQAAGAASGVTTGQTGFPSPPRGD